MVMAHGTIHVNLREGCFLMIRRPPRSTLDRSSAASDVYKRQGRDVGVHVEARFGQVDLVEACAERRGRSGHHRAVKGTGHIQQCGCLLYTSPSPRDRTRSRMPSSA